VLVGLSLLVEFLSGQSVVSQLHPLLGQVAFVANAPPIGGHGAVLVQVRTHRRPCNGVPLSVWMDGDLL